MHADVMGRNAAPSARLKQTPSNTASARPSMQEAGSAASRASAARGRTVRVETCAIIPGTRTGATHLERPRRRQADPCREDSGVGRGEPYSTELIYRSTERLSRPSGALLFGGARETRSPRLLRAGPTRGETDPRSRRSTTCSLRLRCFDAQHRTHAGSAIVRSQTARMKAATSYCSAGQRCVRRRGSMDSPGDRTCGWRIPQAHADHAVAEVAFPVGTLSQRATSVRIRETLGDRG